jgi:hypothetical protein
MAGRNPYFAISAIFLLGLRGIAKQIPLTTLPISHLGDDRSKAVKLSTSLEDATMKMMRPGSVAREVLGDAFVDHYGGTREHEVKLWNEAVTNWEGEFLVTACFLLLISCLRSRAISRTRLTIYSILCTVCPYLSHGELCTARATAGNMQLISWYSLDRY